MERAAQAVRSFFSDFPVFLIGTPWPDFYRTLCGILTRGLPGIFRLGLPGISRLGLPGIFEGLISFIVLTAGYGRSPGILLRYHNDPGICISGRPELYRSRGCIKGLRDK